MAKEQNYIFGGHRTEKFVLEGRGAHRTYLLDEWNKWGGDTAQHLQKKLNCGWSKPENNATLWLHLASCNLPDSQNENSRLSRVWQYSIYQLGLIQLFYYLLSFLKLSINIYAIRYTEILVREVDQKAIPIEKKSL